MGVSGCGKTTLGRLCARSSGMDFVEGDDFHSEAAKRKMASGKALSDQDRLPWLHRICQACQLRQSTAGLLVACSALKRSYRDVFRGYFGSGVGFIHIDVDQGTLRRRMSNRKGHFFPASLLDSQFRTLQAPESDELHCVVPGTLTLDRQRQAIESWIQGRSCA